jgi:hypothetical protein
VIKSSVGFLVVRLDDVQPAKVKPLADVRDDIAAKVKQEKALDAYYALQQKVSDAASNDNESLASAAQVGVKVVETGWFGRDNLPEELNFKPVLMLSSTAVWWARTVRRAATPISSPSMAIAPLFCASASTKRKR